MTESTGRTQGAIPIAVQALSAAGVAAPAALLVSLPGLVVLSGYDHLAYGIGLLAGIVLAVILVIPRVAATGALSPTEALYRRFGSVASRPAAVVLLLMLLPLLAVEFTLLGILSESLLHVPYPAAVAAALLLSALAALLPPAALRAFAGIAFVALAASVLVPLALLAASDLSTVWPHAMHGEALTRIQALEEKLIEAGRVDFDTFAAHATPFVTLERHNVLALIASLALGIAVMPPLIAALSSPGSPGRRRLAGAWAAFCVMILLVAMPMLAAAVKLAVYDTMTSDTKLESLPRWLEAPLAADLARVHGTSLALLTEVARATDTGAADPATVAGHLHDRSTAMASRWAALPPDVQSRIVSAARGLAGNTSAAASWDAYRNVVAPAAARAAGNEASLLTQAGLTIEPLGIWLAVPEVSGAPALVRPLMIGAAILAALLMAAILMRSVIGALPGGAAHGKPPPFRFGAGIALAAAAAFLAGLLRPQEPVAIALAALSLGAAGLFPVLVVGLAWKRTSRAAAAAAIVLGAAVTLAYDVGIQTYPAAFYKAWPSASNAGEYAIEEFDARDRAWRDAEEGPAKSQAEQALDDWARGTPTRPGLANWFGIDRTSGAVFGVPVGLFVLVVMTLARPRREVPKLRPQP